MEQQEARIAKLERYFAETKSTPSATPAAPITGTFMHVDFVGGYEVPKLRELAVPAAIVAVIVLLLVAFAQRRRRP
jgi:hypothetical protein